MLTLTRMEGQALLIGTEIEVVVREVRGRQARIGVVAPRGLPVLRGELHEQVAAQNMRASRTPSLAAVADLERTLRPSTRPPPARGGRR